MSRDQDKAGVLSIAVVGHTNTGKTSLLRTLARDAGFGEVANAPATTRQVEGIALAVGGQPAIELYDTPGLEQASEVYELLQEGTGGRHDGPDRIQNFLRQHSVGPMEQEARVLSQVLESEAVVYVIDAREPVLEKYQDELAVLAMTARPVLPVLNFVALDQARPDEWTKALARVGLHTVAAFDTVVFEPEAETRLWNSLAGLVSRHQGIINGLIKDRSRDTRWRHQAARQRSAEFLVDAAAARQRVRRDDEDARAAGLADLKHRIGEGERACLRDLVELFRFTADDWEKGVVPELTGEGAVDLADPEKLRQLGVSSGKYAGSGAAAGAVFDLSTGGLSLGAGTLVGTLAGAGVAGIGNFRNELGDRLTGYQSLAPEPALVCLLFVRQQRLLAHLFSRGHGAVHPFRMDESLARQVEKTALPRTLKQARVNPKWSAFNNPSRASRSRGRGEAVKRLADELARAPEHSA